MMKLQVAKTCLPQSYIVSKFFFYKFTQVCFLISRPLGDFPTVQYLMCTIIIVKNQFCNTCCLVLFAPDYKDPLTEPSELVHFPLVKLSIWH